ncbi:alpha/beta fold hydrolase [Streptomyces lydicus]|uniref:alpha/beta fold hydrolase n=1 Tax=Streptomyces lydicus TaxID=47763 RepID=UPI0013E93849|nr:alpha/beta hydrolase [Streptomyces lydicus]MCZ1007413.1 alpha/beta hydrolase [Streptomyces lydicus]
MAELVTTATDGTHLTALDNGSGPTLFLVHGGSGDASSWDGVIPSLVNDFRVVRMTRRIYAPGAGTPQAHSMAVEAADVLAIAGLLDRPVFLVGHSSGAVAALEAALRAPGMFAGLFLYEPPMPTRSLVGAEAARHARKALAAGDPGEAMRIHLRDIVQLPAELVETLVADPKGVAVFASKAAGQVADVDALDALGVGVDRFRRLDVPTTLVEGEMSPAHLRERLADLAVTLPQAQVRTLTGQGHAAQLTAPEVLADAIREAAERVLG